MKELNLPEGVVKRISDDMSLRMAFLRSQSNITPKMEDVYSETRYIAGIVIAEEHMEVYPITLLYVTYALNILRVTYSDTRRSWVFIGSSHVFKELKHVSEVAYTKGLYDTIPLYTLYHKAADGASRDFTVVEHHEVFPNILYHEDDSDLSKFFTPPKED